MVAVAHIGAEGFGVDAGGDHEGGVGVAALVESDGGQVPPAAHAFDARLANWREGERVGFACCRT